jgi:rhodanese-related sulfurtransferase
VTHFKTTAPVEDVMKKLIMFIYAMPFLFISTVLAQEYIPIPITAEEAFDAVQLQVDPISGIESNIVMVDVRSRAEYFWIGSACQMEQIITSNDTIILPDNGKVRLSNDGRFLDFSIDGMYRRLNVRNVAEVTLTPIAVNIPFKLWNEDTVSLEINEAFKNEVEALADDYDRIIFFCRSGDRTSSLTGSFDTQKFTEIYEIDQPDGQIGLGGFEGSSYQNVYNGYRGFPDRMTEIQEHFSVSWKDFGFPIKIGMKP